MSDVYGQSKKQLHWLNAFRDKRLTKLGTLFLLVLGLVPFLGKDQSQRTPRRIKAQNEWISKRFHIVPNPDQEEWCVTALQEGTFWHSETLEGGAQFSQDVFVIRNLFWEKFVLARERGLYVEAGANHWKRLSSTYMLDRCFGWNGVCIEPQSQYQRGLHNGRTCEVAKMCLTNESTDKMMVGGRDIKGPLMYIKPLPEDGELPKDGGIWEQISCAPLLTVLENFASHYRNKEGKFHIDFFALDVEGAELLVLDTVDWNTITFGVIMIETQHIRKDREKLDRDMLTRGYKVAYDLALDTIYVPMDEVLQKDIWTPEKIQIGLK
mmetsp:Transcript_43880/g.92312  ORF Transcript_43880/g.92312 Transcript_43880/m.92312 type:complete len:323 (-) Transcript_43880:192-1160(-)|eukprot:CAMPEP_0183738636 /NCGR_PEP_ID=MMETSP0737-20130205/55088_1 /TAXON_ID=385413 /ORGANISM="Thalassiosira miniscula, Strain CCMP1093" /LENGTH=322 /DNA_ID=CAMNT_0025973213 /DNA_START=67 /DNA_END=1035 /DNA_ORIENTATION=-